MNVDLVPQSVLDAIANQQTAPIIKELSTLCPKALKDVAALHTVQSIIHRLLDPKQEYDEVLDVDQNIGIAQQLASVALNLRDPLQDYQVRQRAYHLQGLLLWLATQSLKDILADYVKAEKKFFQTPEKGYLGVGETEHGENQRLFSGISQSYNFVSKQIRELNSKVTEFHPQLFVAYQSLLYVSGYFAQFNSTYEDAITAYQQVLLLSDSISTHFPALLDSPKELEEADITPSSIDTWLKWTTRTLSSTFCEGMKVLLILPLSPVKTKATTAFLQDARLDTLTPQIDETFAKATVALLQHTETTYFTANNTHVDASIHSLVSLVQRVASTQLVTKFEIIFICSLFHVPHADIIQCYPPTASTSISTASRHDSMHEQDQPEDDDDLAATAKVKFHPTLLSFIQHNILAASKFISTISLSLLGTEMLYLSPDSVSSIVEPILHDMIVSKKLPYTAHINAVTQTITFYDVKQNPMVQMRNQFQANSDLLKDVYDAHNLAVQQPSM